MQKWKQGIVNTTPLQSTNAQITFTVISMIGIALGFAVSIYAARNLWWLAIILGAAFGNTFIGYVALKQKQKLLLQMEIPDMEELKGGLE